MARKDKSFLGTLNAKKEELVTSAVLDRENANSIEKQVAGLRASANVSEKQASAIDQAAAILSDAGVTF